MSNKKKKKKKARRRSFWDEFWAHKAESPYYFGSLSRDPMRQRKPDSKKKKQSEIRSQ
jgi:hypothetical protein